MRHINKAGLELVKSFEGLRLKVYLDPVNILTVGYGHTGKELRLGQSITKEKAEELLKADLFSAESAVENCVVRKINDNQFSALVSFAFNVGNGAMKNSTLVKLLNQGAPKEAVADQFLRWNKAGGKALPGLTRRRRAERELFLS